MKYHIWTEGCQMNFADSRRLASSLEKLDYESTDNPSEADLIILNTCVVRQSAENKAIGRLSSLRPLKQKKPDLIINLMGCLIGVHGNEAIQKRFPWVDVFSPPSDPSPLLTFLKNNDEHKESQSWRNKIDRLLDEPINTPAESQQVMVSENLPIVLGCSHACAYCVIPHRRGRETSRKFDIIVNEAENLVRAGAKELVLLGQIVDRYGLDLRDGLHLDKLLEKISEIEDLKRIRFLTSHPNWMTDELIEAVANLPKVMPHIEVPIQAGDDEILVSMRRGYSVAQYRNLINKIRNKIPGVSIATDIIVGFPGESHNAFIHTKELLEELRMDVAHLARYSPRPNTYSARFLEDNVPDEEKMQRFRELELLQEKISSEINSTYKGKTISVLFEEKVKTRWRGRTPTNKLVFVESNLDLRGVERTVNINWTGPWSMIGEINSF